MRISDWSSDVCSSDLPNLPFSQRGQLATHPTIHRMRAQRRLAGTDEHFGKGKHANNDGDQPNAGAQYERIDCKPYITGDEISPPDGKEKADRRSDDRRVREGCDSPSSTRWSLYTERNKKTTVARRFK